MECLKINFPSLLLYIPFQLTRVLKIFTKHFYHQYQIDDYTIKSMTILSNPGPSKKVRQLIWVASHKKEDANENIFIVQLEYCSLFWMFYSCYKSLQRNSFILHEEHYGLSMTNCNPINDFYTERGNPVSTWICDTWKIINPSRPEPGLRKKINLSFYFHTSLWCLKRFYEGLKGLHKTFWDTTKKYENKRS